MIEAVRNKGLALAVLATAQFMVILDATIVNVALRLAAFCFWAGGWQICLGGGGSLWPA
jgi:hypothetical protein